MNKYSIPELSIIFSIKVDSKDRIENLEYLLEYYDCFFSKFEIIIVEQDTSSKLKELLKNRRNIIHFFLPTSNCHYKTRNLNLGTNLATRQVIMMSDIDIICPPQAIKKALQLINQGGSFIAPYNGIVVEIKKEFLAKINSITELITSLEYFPKDFNLNLEKFNYNNMQPMYGGTQYDNTGGCLLYTKKDFYAVGGWNTNFISYGFEDMEFVYRIKKLGYTLKRIEDNNIYHIEHKRSTDSFYNNFYRSNEQEWLNVNAMSAAQLLEYSLNGFKKVILDNQKEIDIVNSDDTYSISFTESSKIDLSGLSIILPLYVPDATCIASLNILVYYFEAYFNNYEIIMIEGESRNCKYLKNKKNVRYHWLGTGPFNYARSVEQGMKESARSIVAIWDFNNLINPFLLDKRLKLFIKSKREKMAFKDSGWYPKGLEKRKKGDDIILLRAN